VVLEAWLLAAAVAAAKPGQDSEAPPIELLEFIGDWTAEEQKLIDQAVQPKKRPAARKKDQSKDVSDEAAETRSGPPR
jgi:hypothetical protein